MKQSKKTNEKTIEQKDYELKTANKFPPDKKFPLTEQSKQNKLSKTKDIPDLKKSNNKIEQNPGVTKKLKNKRIY